MAVGDYLLLATTHWWDELWPRIRFSLHVTTFSHFLSYFSFSPPPPPPPSNFFLEKALMANSDIGVFPTKEVLFLQDPPHVLPFPTSFVFPGTSSEKKNFLCPNIDHFLIIFKNCAHFFFFFFFFNLIYSQSTLHIKTSFTRVWNGFYASILYSVLSQRIPPNHLKP